MSYISLKFDLFFTSGTASLLTISSYIGHDEAHLNDKEKFQVQTIIMKSVVKGKLVYNLVKLSNFVMNF